MKPQFVFCSAFVLSFLFFASCSGKPKTYIPATTTLQSDPAEKYKPQVGTASFAGNDLSLFDGKTLTGWKQNNFGGSGGVNVENGAIRLDMGAELTGITWTNDAILPATNYEISLQAMKIDGGDFFCGLTFPVQTNFATLIVGGWGGGLVGISSLDGMDASENDTTKFMSFEKNRWYDIRLQVTPKTIQTWIDGDKIMDVEIEGRNISMRPGEIEQCIPLGIATWQTAAAVKNIKIKRL